MPRNRKSLFPLTEQNRRNADEQLLEMQRSVDFDTKEFTVEILVHKFLNKDLIVPSWQRDFVWSDAKKSRFIESVLLGLPIPFMFGADNPKTGAIEIVDGVQRINTLTQFMANDLLLSPLDKLSFLSDFHYSDLHLPQQRRFKNRSLRMIVLSEHSDRNTRFDIFERINTGSLDLEASELRKGAYPGPFYDFVSECSMSQVFREVCPITAKRRKRGEDEELVLRYFAYAEQYKRFQHDVARFLNDYLHRNNRGFDRAKKKRQFEAVMRFVSKYFPHGFAKNRSARTTPRVRFEALAVGVHLALLKEPRLVPPNMEWLESEEFKEHTTTHASNSAPRLKARVEYVRDALLGAL